MPYSVSVMLKFMFFRREFTATVPYRIDGTIEKLDIADVIFRLYSKSVWECRYGITFALNELKKP